MQDKTINNALIALCRRGDDQSALARDLLALRGVPVPVFQDRPANRRAMRRLVLSMMPCTTSDVASALQEALPGISRRRAVHRAYMALRRLEDVGLVGRDGRVWMLSACKFLSSNRGI